MEAYRRKYNLIINIKCGRSQCCVINFNKQNARLKKKTYPHFQTFRLKLFLKHRVFFLFHYKLQINQFQWVINLMFLFSKLESSKNLFRKCEFIMLNKRKYICVNYTKLLKVLNKAVSTEPFSMLFSDNFCFNLYLMPAGYCCVFRKYLLELFSWKLRTIDLCILYFYVYASITDSITCLLFTSCGRNKLSKKRHLLANYSIIVHFSGYK